MSRRKTQVFNLSFLDLVTGALGAVIFLFIITPKGGSSAAVGSQAVVYVDTTERKIFGTLDDSLQHKRVGDTLFAVLVDYKNFPKPEKRKVVEKLIDFNQPKSQDQPPAPKKMETKRPTPPPPIPAKEEPKEIPGGPRETTDFKGDAPSVPARVSFEVTWGNQADNVDFFVCRGRNCVYGGRKRDKAIGQWDSGKSRNGLFGNDLRTTQEAVRQFDKVIPGEYELYAQFKESKGSNTKVTIKGLIYTKGRSNQQRGETFFKTLPISKKRIPLGKVIINPDGSYKFIKK